MLILNRPDTNLLGDQPPELINTVDFDPKYSYAVCKRYTNQTGLGTVLLSLVSEEAANNAAKEVSCSSGESIYIVQIKQMRYMP